MRGQSDGPPPPTIDEQLADQEPGPDTASEGQSGATRRGAGAAVEQQHDQGPAATTFSAPSTTPVPFGTPASGPAATPASTAPTTPAPATAAAPQAAAVQGAGQGADAGSAEQGPAEHEARPAPTREPAEAQRPAEAARPTAEPAPTTAEGRAAAAPRVAEGGRAQAPTAPQHQAPAHDAAEHAASILQQVRLRLLPGAREATLQLEPARLGRLSIRLQLRDGVTRAEVVADEAATLEVLARHEPELRAALADAGFEGVEVDLRHADEGERGGFAFDQQPRHGAHAPQPERPPAALSRALAARLTTNDGVDTYA